jgi:hypothetical protein
VKSRGFGSRLGLDPADGCRRQGESDEESDLNFH